MGFFGLNADGSSCKIAQLLKQQSLFQRFAVILLISISEYPNILQLRIALAILKC